MTWVGKPVSIDPPAERGLKADLLEGVEQVRALLATINEMRPLDEHADPRAIEDVKTSAREWLEGGARIYTSSQEACWLHDGPETDCPDCRRFIRARAAPVVERPSLAPTERSCIIGGCDRCDECRANQADCVCRGLLRKIAEAGLALEVQCPHEAGGGPRE